MNKVHPENKAIEMVENKNNVPQSIQRSKPSELTYAIDDVPPWYLSVFLGFQVTIAGVLYVLIK